MTTLIKYTCTYCGVPEVSEKLPSWELPKKRCLKCNHGKFRMKELPEGSNNPFGYPDDDQTLNEFLEMVNSNGRED